MDVLVFGNRSFASLAWHAIVNDSPHRAVGFTVDRAFLADKEKHGLPVVPFEEVEHRFSPDTTALLLSIGWEGMNGLRERKYAEARAKGYGFVGYTSTRALVWPDRREGEACIVFDGAIVQPFAALGTGVILRSGCHLSHHVSVGDFAFVSAGAVIGGGASLGRRSFIGLNATVRDGISIGEGALIGAGVTVNRDVPPGTVLAAVPPKPIPSATRGQEE